MADEAKLHELLDIYEQAKAEGDDVTAQKVAAAYKAANEPSINSSQPAPSSWYGLAGRSGGPKEIGRKALGGAELLGQLASGTGSSVYGGIAGAMTPLTNALGLTKDDPANLVRGIQERYTYQPQTKAGQQAAAQLAVPLGAVEKGQDWLGQGVADYTGSPAIGAFAKTLPQAVLAAIGVRGPATPFTQALKAAKPSQVAATTLERAGIPVTAAQATGSKAMGQLQSVLDKFPFSGAEKFSETQRQAFNRAALRTVGEDAKAATSDVMQRAQRRIGDAIDDIQTRNPTNFDTKLAGDLQTIVADAAAEMDDAQFGVINRQLANITNKSAQGSQLAGKTQQNIRQSLNRLSMSPDQTVGHYARLMRDALDDALERSVSSQDHAALVEARQQYRSMKQIESSIDNEGTGNISPSKLANSLGTKTNAAQSKYGKGPQDLVQLAQAGKQILPDKIPNSGTPQRQLYQLGTVGGAAGWLGLLPAAKIVATGAALPRLLRSQAFRSLLKPEPNVATSTPGLDFPYSLLLQQGQQ